MATSIPHATRQKAKWAMSIFSSWAKWTSENNGMMTQGNNGITELLKTELWHLTNEQLDKVLSCFVQQVRNRKGDLYPPKTLYEIITSIQKFMEMQQKCVSLVNRNRFPTLYYALDVSMKNATLAGKGMGVKHAQPITVEQESALYDKNIINIDTPKGLQRALFYTIGIHFALRGGKAHRDLTIHNFKIQDDESGKRYLCYTEKVAKTRQGGIKDLKIKEHSARAYSNPDPRKCPVGIFQKYVQLCPQEPLSSALYLQPLKKPSCLVWYGKTPVGNHTLGDMVKSMMTDAGFEGQFTNHSLRVTTVTRLFDSGQDIKVVKGQTGHRSDALLEYRRLDDEKKQEVSAMLTNSAKKMKTEQTISERHTDQQHDNPSKEMNYSKSNAPIINVTGGNVTINIHQ